MKINNEYIYDDGGRHQYFRMKYKKDRVGDCVVRALTIATGEDYKDVRTELWETSLENGYMPNSNENYEQFLLKRGFVPEKKIKGFNLGRYPLCQNCTYVVRLSRHVVCLDQGLVRDIWYCRAWYPYKTWRKPKTINK